MTLNDNINMTGYTVFDSCVKPFFDLAPTFVSLKYRHHLTIFRHSTDDDGSRLLHMFTAIRNQILTKCTNLINSQDGHSSSLFDICLVTLFFVTMETGMITVFSRLQVAPEYKPHPLF